MSLNELQTQIEGPIAKFIINRPERLNALTIDLAKTIHQEFLSLENDETLKVLVLSGSGGRAFSAGGDVSEFANASSGADYIHDLTGHLHAIVEAFRESHILTIASIRGAVAGAGMGLCLATDFRIASEKTLFNLAFINLALSPDTSSTFFLPRLVGMSAAAKIALLGERVDAKEAGKLGLVHYVVKDEDLESQTEEFALRCANAPRLGIKRTKQLLNQSFNSTLTEQLQLERKYVVECANTDDFQEGLQAFLEKRRPNFH
ncbi:MAG: enoyl-CoA hydratase/isomerase family protein [Candidatus Hodarchaeota archaeon]